MNKLAQFLKKYRNEVIVGVLVFLVLIFRDVIKSLFKIVGSSTFQFPDSYILNHHIIVASFVCKGSKQESH